MHTYNPNTQEAAAGGLFQIGGLGKIQNEFKGYLGCRVTPCLIKVCVCYIFMYISKMKSS